MRSTTNSARARTAPKVPAARARRSNAGRRATAPAHDSWRDPRLEFNEDEWHDMIAAAAAWRAEACGFSGGDSEDDWCETEAELRERLARAEEEADEKSESASDLTDHDTWRETEDRLSED